MEALKANWKIILAVIIILFIAYQYQKYIQEQEELKRKQESGEAPQPCQKISYEEFNQRKTDWYWKGRNLDKTAVDTIVNKYKIASDGCNFRKAVWRWAYDKVIEDGYCEVSAENDIL